MGKIKVLYIDFNIEVGNSFFNLCSMPAIFETLKEIERM